MSKPFGKPDRIVVALGGNALGNNPVEQIEAVSNTAHALLGLIEQGNEIIITHGNGPQVGMIQNAFAAAHDAIGTPEMPHSGSGISGVPMASWAAAKAFWIMPTCGPLPWVMMISLPCSIRPRRA